MRRFGLKPVSGTVAFMLSNTYMKMSSLSPFLDSICFCLMFRQVSFCFVLLVVVAVVFVFVFTNDDKKALLSIKPSLSL